MNVSQTSGIVWDAYCDNLETTERKYDAIDRYQRWEDSKRRKARSKSKPCEMCGVRMVGHHRCNRRRESGDV